MYVTMTNYVDIETLFESAGERTVEKLSEYYLDADKLANIVRRIMGRNLSSKLIEGQSILIKPNWVRQELKESDYICLRTNDNLLLCVVEELLTMNPSKILIADAPIQGCSWNKMITQEFLEKVESLALKYDIPVSIKDFRRTIYDKANNSVERDLKPISNYVIFDLGEDSYLEPITTENNKFRVTCYNPDRMAKVHHKGMHKYCVAKDVFDYDIVITMPKLKTHRMAGITNSLKLLVGINGDKDYLPHHRIGSVSEGGDNYKNKNILRTIANSLIDAGNRRRGTTLGRLLGLGGVVLWRVSRPDMSTLANAGWYGNDTIWRTVLDLNTIALYGDSEGRIHKEQQRHLYTIMDGIIGGQGEGPLFPDPSPLGILAMSDNPYLMDVVAGHLYHLKIEKIPLLKEAAKLIESVKYKLLMNTKEISLNDISDYGIDITMTSGWQNYDK